MAQKQGGFRTMLRNTANEHELPFKPKAVLLLLIPKTHVPATKDHRPVSITKNTLHRGASHRTCKKNTVFDI
jgi:hypothetical protein